jgi:hypothetical protein
MSCYYIKGVLIEVNSKKLGLHAADALSVILDEKIARISAHSSVEDARDSLDELAGFQEELAVVAFRWNVELPPRLRLFVREFDRADDLMVRSIVFGKIKAGQFLLRGGQQNPIG